MVNFHHALDFAFGNQGQGTVEDKASRAGRGQQHLGVCGSKIDQQAGDFLHGYLTRKIRRKRITQGYLLGQIFVEANAGNPFQG